MFASVSTAASCKGLQSIAAERPVPRLSMITRSRVARSGSNRAEVLLARLGGREARSAFGGDQRARGRCRPGVRVVLEVDGDPSRDRTGGVQRPLERPTPGGGRRAAMQFDLSHLQQGAGRARRGRLHRGGDPQQHDRRIQGPPGSYAGHGCRSFHLHCAPGRRPAMGKPCFGDLTRVTGGCYCKSGAAGQMAPALFAAGLVFSGTIGHDGRRAFCP